MTLSLSTASAAVSCHCPRRCFLSLDLNGFHLMEFRMSQTLERSHPPAPAGGTPAPQKYAFGHGNGNGHGHGFRRRAPSLAAWKAGDQKRDCATTQALRDSVSPNAGDGHKGRSVKWRERGAENIKAGLISKDGEKKATKYNRDCWIVLVTR